MIRSLLVDTALTVGLLAVTLAATPVAGAHQPGSVPLDGVGRALIAVVILPLAVRRRRPLGALAVTAPATAAYLAAGYPYGPMLIGYVLAVYTVALRAPLRRAALAAGLAALALAVHALWSLGASPGWSGLLPTSAWTIVPFALGVTVRISREAVLRDRAAQARRQADDERLRIAQEVHDVVGHGLAAINMQAEIALHLLPKRPEQAETALAAIARTSREALDELRVTLAVVRRGADRRPAPGLDQVPALRERLAGAGVPVVVTVTGTRRDLPAAVDLAAYRVVQESLTNVLRHAGSAVTADVLIGYGDEEVTVEVIDTGSAEPAGRTGRPGAGGDARAGAGGAAGPVLSGQGIAGMRERVTALGGTFDAGPREGGGFRVYARIPAGPRR
ncbi:two-component sensor histidine kinase [Plantactinospora sp. KBS50]|nr:two-component sensor histidine kinase [Plantactinospora sp. KBS50]